MAFLWLDLLSLQVDPYLKIVNQWLFFYISAPSFKSSDVLIPTPSPVVFREYEVGEVYEVCAKFTLSLGSNTSSQVVFNCLNTVLMRKNACRGELFCRMQGFKVKVIIL